jgi:histidinol dehydrogenase
MARRLNARAKTFGAEFAQLLETTREAEGDVSRIVKDIIADVRARGDAALIDLAARFDRATLTQETLRVGPDEIAVAERSCSKEAKAALFFAARARSLSQAPGPDESFIDESAPSLSLDGAGFRGTYVPGERHPIQARS